MTRSLKIINYGLVLSAIIALIVSGFLVILNQVVQIYLNEQDWFGQLLLIIGGSGLLWFFEKKWPQTPQLAPQALAALHGQSAITLRPAWQNLLVGIIILGCGAGVAPGTILISVTITLSIWLAEKLRYVYFHYARWQQLTIFNQLRRLGCRRQYRLSYRQQHVTQPGQQRLKQGLIGLFILNGLTVFILSQRLTHQPRLVTPLVADNWQWSNIWSVLPIILFTASFAHLWQWGKQQCQRWLHHWSLAVRIGVGGILIYILTRLVPQVLFSGQLRLPQLIAQWSNLAPVTLLLLAGIKLGFLALCLQLGWTGGDFLPSLVVGFLVSFAVAQWLPQVTASFWVALIATSLTGSLVQRPLLAGIIVALFCPASLWPVVGCAAFGTWGLAKIWPIND
ncbi:chloride channel protein [Lactiplantibacillus daowaiensis]|uniref:Chloride channel protein n=1 Tax=Lactiplantibacillus daowaiensis TaxID=2559918 RepID=A0ABW1S0C8_9LACO|nr:chloride channel protein [Lactiplantibacillus daowaiensis]